MLAKRRAFFASVQSVAVRRPFFNASFLKGTYTSKRLSVKNLTDKDESEERTVYTQYILYSLAAVKLERVQVVGKLLMRAPLQRVRRRRQKNPVDDNDDQSEACIGFANGLSILKIIGYWTFSFYIYMYIHIQRLQWEKYSREASDSLIQGYLTFLSDRTYFAFSFVTFESNVREAMRRASLLDLQAYFDVQTIE